MIPGFAMMCSPKVGTVVATQTLLSATNKDSTIVVEGGGTIARATADPSGMVLSAVSKSSGKYYFEIVIVADKTGGIDAVAAGVKNATSALSTYLGADSTAWATWAEGSAGSWRTTYYNASQTNVTTGHPTPAIGDRCRIAVDLDAGKLWLSKWGSTTWIGGGDPALGTSPTYTIPAGTYYIAIQPRGMGRKLSLVAPTSWASSAPSGFGVWTA